VLVEELGGQRGDGFAADAESVRVERTRTPIGFQGRF
jgi:hypothetical protein